MSLGGLQTTKRMKNISKDTLSRIKTGGIPGRTSAVATFGLTSAGLGLAGVVGVYELLVTGLLSIGVGVVVAYVRGYGQIFPRNLVDRIRNDEAPYKCDYCTRASLAEACELTRPHYRDEYVSGDHAETWRLKNPKAFVHLLNKDNELCATFGVISLTPSFTEQFLKGNVTDLLLSADDILDFQRSKQSRSLYISGVVVRNPDTHLGHKRTAAMLWAMMQYIEKLYRTRKKRMLYAIAVTHASGQLMRNLGFTLTCEGQRRQDGYDLYSFELTSETWRTMKEKVRVFGDFSAACICQF